MKRRAIVGLLIAISLSINTTATLAQGDCTDYVDLSGGEFPIEVSGSTDEASADYTPFEPTSVEPDCWHGNWFWGCGLGPDVTYKWTAPYDDRFTFNIVDSDFDAVLLIYDFTCPTEPVYPDDFICGSKGAPISRFELTANTEILIVVDGVGNQSGVYDLAIHDSNSIGTIVWDTMPADYITANVDHDIPLKIYLPPGHSPGGDPYRVYLYLHGGGFHDYNTYTVMHGRLDELIIAGTIDPIVVVWPNVQWPGTPDPDGDLENFDNVHAYTDSNRNGDYESVIATDLIAWVRDPSQHAEPYNLSSNPNEYAIGGFSMGGAASICIGARHLDKFSVCASQSGLTAYNLFLQWLPWLLDEYPDAPPYDWDPDAGSYSTWSMGFAASFSPNPNGNLPLWGMDFWVDSEGELIPEILYDIWIAENDPIELLRPLKEPGGEPGEFVLPIALYFDVGSTEDNLAWNDRFDSDLMAEGIVGYEYIIWQGGGHVLTADAVDASLIFIDHALDESTTGVQPQPRNYDIGLAQNHPNPFNPQTTITFTLGKRQRAEVAVYDLTGKLLDVLAARTYNAGDNSVVWNGKDAIGRAVPSGTYIVRLKTESGVEARKVMLVR